MDRLGGRGRCAELQANESENRVEKNEGELDTDKDGQPHQDPGSESVAVQADAEFIGTKPAPRGHNISHDG